MSERGKNRRRPTLSAATRAHTTFPSPPPLPPVSKMKKKVRRRSQLLFPDGAASGRRTLTVASADRLRRGRTSRRAPSRATSEAALALLLVLAALSSPPSSRSREPPATTTGSASAAALLFAGGRGGFGARGRGSRIDSRPPLPRASSFPDTLSSRVSPLPPLAARSFLDGAWEDCLVPPPSAPPRGFCRSDETLDGPRRSGRAAAPHAVGGASTAKPLRAATMMSSSGLSALRRSSLLHGRNRSNRPGGRSGATTTPRTAAPRRATRRDDADHPNVDAGGGGGGPAGGSSGRGKEEKRRRDRVREWLLANRRQPSSSSSAPPSSDGGGGTVPAETPPPPPKKRKREVVKTKFDALFRDVPSLGEILYSDDDGVQAGGSPAAAADGTGEETTKKKGRKKKKNKNRDDPVDVAEIDQRMLNFRDEMLSRLSEMRSSSPSDDPSSAEVPQNAEAVIEAMVEERRSSLLKERRERRAAESFRELEAWAEAEAEARLEGSEGETFMSEDAILQDMIDDVESTVRAMDELKEQKMSFEEYERELRAKADAEARVEEERTLNGRWKRMAKGGSDAVDAEEKAGGVSASDGDADRRFDEESMDRMKKALEGRSKRKLGRTSNLERGIEELTSAIESKKGKKSQARPENLKEWQMYRSIATRLGEEASVAEEDGSSTEEEESEEEIASKMRQWKEFQELEEKMREESGLGLPTKMPFEWMERRGDGDGRSEQESRAAEEGTTAPPRDPVEARREADLRALEAMEDLLRKRGSNAIRGENLARGIESMKADLLAAEEELARRKREGGKDDAAAGTGANEGATTKSVDVSDVFGVGARDRTYSSSVASAATGTATAPPPPSSADRRSSVGADMSSAFAPPNPPPNPPLTPFFDEGGDDDVVDDDGPTEAVRPPDTPFFSDDAGGGETTDVPTDAALPPSTPFFAEDDDDEDVRPSTTEDMAGGGRSLGTMEEQKLRSMSRRAGARTEEEEERIRRGYEDFRAAESAMREKMKLGTTTDEDVDGKEGSSLDASDVGYDVDEALRDGGSAEKVLESIGPRPGRKEGGGAAGAGRAPSAGGASTEKKDAGSVAPRRPAEEERDAAFQEFLEQERIAREEELRRSMESGGVGGPFSAAAAATASSSTDDEAKKKEEQDIYIVRHRPVTRDPGTATDQMYRSVSTKGGKKETDDERAVNKAAYERFLRKEEELRRKIDDMDSEDGAKDIPVVEVGDDEDFDDEEYAANVLSSLGPRRKGKKKEEEGERSYARDDGAAAAAPQPFERDGLVEDEVELIEALPAEEGPTQKPSAAAAGEKEPLPEWLQRERDAMKDWDSYYDNRRTEGVDRDSSSSGEGTAGSRAYLEDGRDNDEEEVDHEKNQRQAEEFERKRSSRGRSMGISIGDVFGRDYFGPDDDYDDYSLTKGRGVGSFSSFESRKENLLEYTELNVLELNALMEHKDSPFATGVSKYQSKVSKPYKEFGTIFRLEGTLVDLTSLQWEAWKKVAEVHGFDAPTVEDVRVASVSRPDVAIRRVFYWTDDVFLCREMSKTHREALREAFDRWTEREVASSGEDIVVDGGEGATEVVGDASSSEASAGEDDGGEGLASSLVQPTRRDEERIHFDSWKAVADAYGLAAPSASEVQFASMLEPEAAVREAFGWSGRSGGTSSLELDMAKLYRRSNRQGIRRWMETHNAGERLETLTAAGGPEPSEEEAFAMKLDAWGKVAETYGLLKPCSAAVQSASLQSPEDAVQTTFGWKYGSPEKKAALFCNFYDDNVLAWRRKGKEGRVDPGDALDKSDSSAHGSDTGFLSDSDLLEMQMLAWTRTAKVSGFELPSLEQVQLAMAMDGDEAVRKVFSWTANAEISRDVAATHRKQLKKISATYEGKYDLAAVPRTVRSNVEDEPETSAVPDRAVVPSEDDVVGMQLRAWEAVAEPLRFDPPTAMGVRLAMMVSPEDAVRDVFKWVHDAEESKLIAARFRKSFAEESDKWRHFERMGLHGRSKPSTPRTKGTPPPRREEEEAALPPVSVRDGATKWVRSLRDVEMPCAVASHLDRDQVDILLSRLGLSELFPPDRRVSSDNGYNRESQEMLGAALRLERRPDHCVVFDSTPSSSGAAHEVDMKAVTMIGHYPQYDLLSADATMKYFDELSTVNLRRLFGENVYDEPMMENQQELPDKQTFRKTRFWEEGDRR